MDLHKVKIRRMGAKVRVTGDPDAIAWVRNRGSRYFELDAPIDDDDVWHIIAGKENAPLLPWHPLERGIPSAPCVFLLNINHRTIVIDATPGPWRKIWTLRLVRDLLRWQLFHEGAVFIHASVVAHQSTGVALVGGKRSGKSTLFLQLLRNEDFGFVAEDDMTVVRKPDGTLVALGWPSCLRIRRSTLKYFPQLADGSNFMHPANELERDGDPEVALLRLFPEEVAARFNSFIMPEISLNMIVRPEWDKQATLVPLSSEGTAEALINAWDILPERRAGVRPQFNGGTFQQWRGCCFNPPLFDFFGTPRDLAKSRLHEIASQLSGYAFHHSGDPELLRTMLLSARLATTASKRTILGNT
jgi:hypothetical protein